MLHSLFKGTKISIKTGNSEKDKDSSENRSSRSSRRAGHHPGNHSGRRLVRSQRIQGLRYSDDDLSHDASRSSLFSTEHSSETVSASTWGSHSPSPSIQCPSNDVTYTPLPPPLSLNGQHSAQGNLSVSSPRSWDGDIRDSDATSGYSTDSALSDGSFKSSTSHGIFSAVTRRSEGDLQNLPGTHIGSPPGVVAGGQRLDQGYGGGLRIHPHVGKVQKSAPNSTHTSPVSSPKAWGSKESQWLWSSVSNNLQQGSSLTSLGSSYVKPTWVDAHPLPPPPTLNIPPASPPASLPSPRSSMVPPRGSSKSDSGPTVCKWQKGRLLGSGAFGRVYKGIHCETGEFCAIKEVEYVEDDLRSKESAKQLEQEIMLLSSLRHPNIVHYKGSEMVDGFLNIYLELVTGGSIYKLYQEFKKLEEPVVRRYTRQILHGLHFLHSRNIVHRDIKGANILVDQEGVVKLADFGMAKQIKRGGADLLSFKGSPYWMAPEVIMQKNTGFECAIDIWSLGCTVLEMVTGKPPWSEYEGVAAMFKVTRAEIPPLPQSLSLEGQSFIKLCLQRNAAGRPSAAALLQHPFVQIPNDCPDHPTQAINISDYLSSSVEERSTTQQNSGSSIGLLRGGSQPLNKRQYSRSRSRQGICPSRSAPVSPRSSHNFMNEFSSAGFSPLPGFSMPPAGSPGRTGFSTPPSGSPRVSGFSTPPGGSPRGTGFSRSPAGIPRVTGFDFYENHEKSSNAPDISVFPSRSAPVSPRSSHNFMNELSSAGFSPLPGFSMPPAGSPGCTGFSTPPLGSPRGSGFSTPPGGSPRGTGFSRSPAGIPRVTGFDFYANHEKSSNAPDISAGRQPHSSNRLPSSSIHDVISRRDSPWDLIYENRQIPHEGESRSNGLPSSSVHDMDNRSDLHWDVEYENRQAPRKGTPRSDGFYRPEDVWSYREEEQDYSRQTYRTLQ